MYIAPDIACSDITRHVPDFQQNVDSSQTLETQYETNTKQHKS